MIPRLASIGRWHKVAVGFAGTALGMAVAYGGRADAQPSASDYQADLTVIEIMASIVMPTAEIIWDAVGVDVTEKGEVQTKPETDEDWLNLRAAAVTLVESTNALIVPGRHAAPPGTVSANPDAELTPAKIDALLTAQRPAWVAHAHVLHAAAMEALNAIDKKDIDGISNAGGTIDAACEGCHLQFWYPDQK
jgi:cytochrome c556